MAWKDWSFDRYRKTVDQLTAQHKGKIKFPEDDRPYEIDHRLQVKLGFNIGVDPRVIANEINLRPLLKEFNASRQHTPDLETLDALNELIDAGFLSEKFRPKKCNPVAYSKVPEIQKVLETLTEDNPIGQVHVIAGVLATIPPIRVQREHETRYGKQLHHFEEVGIRPQHRRFTVSAFKDKNGEWQLRLSDGNTRKHNIIHDYFMFFGLTFPEKVTLDIMWAPSEEEADKDSELLDALGAGKTITDLVQGGRRKQGFLGGIIIEKLNRAKGWLNIAHTTFHGTNNQMDGKEDIDGFLNSLDKFYSPFQFIVNDLIAGGKAGVNTPSGFQDNVIAAMMRMYIKHGDACLNTLQMFVERRKNHTFGERDLEYPILHVATQAIHVMLDEIEKFDDGDINDIEYYKSHSVTGNLPRRILPNSNSDSNFKIIAGLLCYGMEASMREKFIDENLYKEFLGNYSTNKDENELRALAKNKVEDYFDTFWE
jgi:hypothetical protein